MILKAFFAFGQKTNPKNNICCNISYFISVIAFNILSFQLVRTHSDSFTEGFPTHFACAYTDGTADRRE